MSPAATTEPAEQACRVLLQYLDEETDPRKRELMIRDCLARAEQLPDAARRDVDQRILQPFRTPGRAVPENPESPVIHTGSPKAVDVLVTTVVPIERLAAQIAFDLGRPTATHDNRRYHETTVPSAPAERDLSVVVTDIGDAGNVSAAVAVGQMRQHYQAGAYFLVGIAAGREGPVDLGDVVLPVIIIDFEGGTAGKKKFRPRPDPRRVPAGMRRNLGYYVPSRTRFYQRLDEKLNELPKEHWPPDFKPPFRPAFPDKVVLATGEKVRRDASLQKLVEHDERLKAADMESTGFATQLGNVPWAVFRGITDFGDEDKADNWHGFAALAACVALRDFLETEYEPPDVGNL
ncbi:MAG: hypothetical protein V7607_2617 [Solirubrobacteraceae bacterium]